MVKEPGGKLGGGQICTVPPVAVGELALLDSSKTFPGPNTLKAVEKGATPVKFTDKVTHSPCPQICVVVLVNATVGCGTTVTVTSSVSVPQPAVLTVTV